MNAGVEIVGCVCVSKCWCGYHGVCVIEYWCGDCDVYASVNGYCVVCVSANAGVEIVVCCE